MTLKRMFQVSEKEAYKRIDQYLANHLPLSRTSIQRLIKENLVSVNKKEVKVNYKIHPDDEVEVTIPGPTPLPLLPEPIPLEILYEDAHLLLVNKPSGLVVHPAPGHYNGTLVNALLHHCRDLKGIGGRERPGIVHRLDKDTSGVLVIAKSDHAHRQLSKQFKLHTVNRVYIALIQGVLKKGSGMIDLPIGRDTKDRKKISAKTVKPRHAITNYKVLRRYHDATLIELRPETGRTHQLRVHLSHMHHPVAGDKIYGGRGHGRLGNVKIGRLMLHAKTLGFTHPETDEYMEVEAPLPNEMREILDVKLRE